MVGVITDLLPGTLEAEIERLTSELSLVKQELKAEIERETKARADEAYKRGAEAGYARSTEEHRAEVDEALALIRQLLGEIESGARAVWDDCREGVARLAIAIASKVVGEVADIHSDLAAEMARRCISMVKEQIRVRVAINPEDARVVRAVHGDLLSSAEGVKEIEIVERSSVPRGGVVVETDAGQLDGRLEEQLDVVRAAIVPDWSRPESEPDNESNQAEDAESD